MKTGRIAILIGFAALVTVMNAWKPAVVDDTAYLAFAQHLAENPSDPYGGLLFWYAYPQPTQEILLPPVLPYWLSLGIGLFGMNLFLLKLSLFPFLLLLAISLEWLFCRFAPGVSGWAVPGVLFGPAVLPMVNVMLDIPALALGLTAIAIFIHGAEGRNVGIWLVAGILTGLAAQTKYTMLTVPGVILAYAVCHRTGKAAFVTLITALLVFVGWEVWVTIKYDVGHFLYHFSEQRNYQESQLLALSPNPNGMDRLKFLIQSKWPLFQPMLGYLGWLGIGAGAMAAAGLGMRSRGLLRLAVTAFIGFAAVGVTPYSQGILVRGAQLGSVKLELSTAVFVTLGTVTAILTLAASVTLFRWRSPRSTDQVSHGQERRDSLFLILWLLVEIAGYFALTPFPAGRRVMAMAVVGTLVAARRVWLRDPSHASVRRAVTVACGTAMLAGTLLFAWDFWDALPERAAADWAEKRILLERAKLGGEVGRVWFNGHWGFQHYCEAAGMYPVIPEQSRLMPGDWLVFPELPDDFGFYRPYHGGAKFAIDPRSALRVDRWTWEDLLAGQTIPALYGGRVPMTGRDHPRLTVGLYRIVRPWIPTSAP